MTCGPTHHTGCACYEADREAMIDAARDALESATLVLAPYCSHDEACTRFGVWRDGPFFFYCDEHVGRARAADAKARSKGCSGGKFVEIDNADVVRQCDTVIRALDERRKGAE